MIKVLTLLARKSDLTHAQFVQIWSDEAPALISAAKMCRRYVQYRLHPDRVWPAVTYAFSEQLITNMLPEDATGGGMVKRLVPLVRTQGWTHEQFIRHWVNVHAELLKKVSPKPRRYCQLYVDAEITPPDGIASLDAHVDGFSESWFVDEEEMNAPNRTPEGEALAADNKIYLSRSKRFFFDEYEYHTKPK